MVIRGHATSVGGHHVVAVNFNAPELCGRINPRADGGGGAWSPAGYQITSLQSSCYRILADAMHDPSLCDRVVAVSTSTLDGSKMDKADCLAGRGSGAIVTADSNAMEPFVALIQSIGYRDREVVESEYEENPENSATFEAYSQLRDDPAFLLRLQSAPSGRPHSCDPLPRAGSSPLINEIYDSYERCRETVAVYSRPTFTSATHYGPAPFPHAADFPAALQAIGYPADYASTLVPTPPLSSYWEFVSRIRFEGTDADRAEFVRRVIALR